MADKKIRRIFLCRHGKTEANEKGTWCGGQNESPLTETGKEQAQLLGNALKTYYNFRGDLIIASPRQRAKQTAEIISESLKYPLGIMVARGLVEIDVGQWNGKTAQEAENLFPEEFKKWQEGNLTPSFRFTGGESMEEAQRRVALCFNAIKQMWLRELKNDLVIVAHGGTNIFILCEIMCAEMKTYGYRCFRQDNACVNIIGFRKKNNWRPETEIVLMNSTHHLDDMGLE